MPYYYFIKPPVIVFCFVAAPVHEKPIFIIDRQSCPDRRLRSLNKLLASLAARSVPELAISENSLKWALREN